jgi:hypothetical protein
VTLLASEELRGHRATPVTEGYVDPIIDTSSTASGSGFERVVSAV